MADDFNIQVTKDGPYFVDGGVPLVRLEIVVNDQGEACEWREIERLEGGECYALCRCGKSASKPFCDGTHTRTGFDGTETASRELYADEAACTDASGIKLRDARRLCAEARFCDRAGAIWNLIERSEEPGIRELIEEEAALCPSGRYTVCDADTGEAHEPELERSVALIEDPQLGVSGPIWVRGGIPITGADGRPYEVRNRVTLCRCGESENKPFCDGSHVAAKFSEAE